jgi:Leucine-rich repeat (LRR) protein
MTLIRTSLGGLGLLLLLNACEDPPKPEEKPVASAAPVASPAPAPAPTPTPAPEAAAPSKPKKTLADCGKGPNAEFDQPGLEAEIRKKLQKPDGPVSLADLKKVHSVNLSQAPRTSQIDVCTFSHLTGLKDLFLGPGDYDDLSVVAGMKDLESLSAAHNSVQDTAPLAKLKKLDRLDLAHSKVADLSVISELTTLTELTLDDTAITDVGPLTKLTKLEKLGIQHTQVKDASALKALKKLKVLYAAGTPADEEGLTLAPVRANGTKVID